MPPRSKQAEKNAERRAAKKGSRESNEPDAAPAEEPSGSFVERAQALVLGSVIVESAPLVPNLVKDGIAIIKGEKTPSQPVSAPNEGEDKQDSQEPDEQAKTDEQKTNEPMANGLGTEQEEPQGVHSVFKKLCSRLHWSNPLGLASPKSGEDSVKAWLALKNLEIDFGPRAKRKGNPSMERIVTNVYNNLPQYLHVLLALMVLRAFLLRSYFACLPWLVGYQVLSVFLPLDKIESLPQIPLAKIPTEIRVVLTICLNGLLQFFFAYELVWKTWFFEKPVLVGLIAFHAYAARPTEA